MPTLAAAQLERDKIKAFKAKQEFEMAYAETVSSEDFDTCHVVLNKVVKNALSELFKRLSDAVCEDSQSDETDLHFRMSDTSFDWLKEVGEIAKSSLDNQDFAKAYQSAIKPKQLMTVSEWAEKNRVIASGTNLPGPWRNENAPHLKDIMDDLSEHSSVRKVTFKKSSGVGGTECLWNWIGYVIHHVQTKDFMLVVPTLTLRDREFNPRFKKMISETPCLTDLVSFKSRDTSTNKDFVEFGVNSRFIKTGANSPDSLRASHVPYAATDEKSAFPWDSGGEGDPDMLIENRQKTFTRRKKLDVSTPTNAGECRITEEYDRSDQRERWVPCPNCGERHVLKWANFKFEYTAESIEKKEFKKIVKNAWMICPHCDQKIEESKKNAMLDAGVWIAKYPHIKDHHGYHINALYIKYGLGKTWTQIAQEWVDAQGDDSKLKSFINTYLGEVWTDKGEGIEAVSLLSRLENYDLTFLNDRPLVTRVAGVDIQKDRFEVTIVDFEESEEAWVQTHLIIPAKTVHKEEWVKLADELTEHNIQLACIDSGYNTSQVYDFCEKRKWCVPIKGMPGMSRPIIEDIKKRRQRLRTRRKKGMPVEPIGVDQAKVLVYARLRIHPKNETEIDQETGEIIKISRTPLPGCIHFNQDSCFDDEYFAQLTAEELVTKKKNGREIQEWKPKRARNETLDCFVYALSAYRLSKGMAIVKPKLIAINNQKTEPQKIEEKPTRTRRMGRTRGR